MLCSKYSFNFRSRGKINKMATRPAGRNTYDIEEKVATLTLLAQDIQVGGGGFNN
jgi:hypothetical protein